MAMIYRDFDFVTTDDLWRAGLTVAFTLVAAMVGFVLLIMLVSRRGAPSGLVLSSATRQRRDDHPADVERMARVVRCGRPARARSHRTAGGWTEAKSSLVGSTGVAVSDLRPGGIVEIDGHRIDAVTSGEFIPAGEPIEVDPRRPIPTGGAPTRLIRTGSRWRRALDPHVGYGRPWTSEPLL
jgi:hypothetical protein